jgi:predicted transport protein
MLVFLDSQNTLTPVERDAFKLEQDIHKLVEPNLETVFQLEYVASEFAVGEFRLDTLAFDQATNSFVIVEYKKGHSYSVVDQGYSYLSVMLNNKAEFVLEYNERTGKQLKRTDIDWASSRIIFVAPSFNTYQKNSVNFRDVPFELWEIRRFDGGIVVLERCESTSNESIEKVTKSASSTISTVAAEVKVPDEAVHLSRIEPKLIPVWAALKARLLERGDTKLDSSNNYIAWRAEAGTVCYVLFRQRELRIEITRGTRKPTGDSSKGFFTLDDPKQMAKETSWTWKSGNTGHQYVLSVTSEAELDYVMYLLEQKYMGFQ